MDWESEQGKSSHYQSMETLKASREKLGSAREKLGSAREKRRKSRRESRPTSENSDARTPRSERGSQQVSQRSEGADDEDDVGANALMARAMKKMSDEQTMKVSLLSLPVLSPPPSTLVYLVCDIL